MEFLSICSGIEAASVAWTPIGWKAVGFSEIDPFACAVLAHRFPDVPNFGDMTTIARRILLGEVPAPDVLCGGTPCQAFSVAGLRESLSDARGNLSLRFCEIADAIDLVRSRAGKPPCIIVWENVPGVLSTKDNAFGCFLAGLAGENDALEPPGNRWANSGAVYGPARAVAWRTLDAQYFGVAQRRRRVFVVSSARAGFDPASVLFEWDGMRRDSAPRGGTGESLAGVADSDTCAGGQWRAFELVGRTLTPAGHSPNPLDENLALGPFSFDEVQITHPANRTTVAPGLPVSTLSGDPRMNVAFQRPACVRRLTPREWERLQGFPDDWTLVPYRGKPAADGPRYKAIGNSWAVPVARWVGERVQMVEKMREAKHGQTKRTA